MEDVEAVGTFRSCSQAKEVKRLKVSKQFFVASSSCMMELIDDDYVELLRIDGGDIVH